MYMEITTNRHCEYEPRKKSIHGVGGSRAQQRVINVASVVSKEDLWRFESSRCRLDCPCEVTESWRAKDHDYQDGEA